MCRSGVTLINFKIDLLNIIFKHGIMCFFGPGNVFPASFVTYPLPIGWEYCIVLSLWTHCYGVSLLRWICPVTYYFHDLTIGAMQLSAG